MLQAWFNRNMWRLFQKGLVLKISNKNITNEDAKSKKDNSFIQIRGKRSVRMRSLYSLVDWNLATFNLITSDINFNKGNTNGNWFHIQTDIQSQKRQKKHEKRISLLRLMRMINYALKANPALKITCAKNIVIRILWLQVFFYSVSSLWVVWANEASWLTLLQCYRKGEHSTNTIQSMQYP